MTSAPGLPGAPVFWWLRSAWLVIVIGAVSVVGYLWNASEIVTDAVLPPVAVNPAAALILLGVGTLHASRKRLEQSPTRPLRRGNVEISLIGAFVLSLALLLIAGEYLYRSVAESQQWVARTQEVRAMRSQPACGWQTSCIELRLEPWQERIWCPGCQRQT